MKIGQVKGEEERFVTCRKKTVRLDKSSLGKASGRKDERLKEKNV